MSVLSIYSLPEVLYSKLRTTTVTMNESDGVICLEPVTVKRGKKRMRGMLSDGRLSVDGFLEMLREDKKRFES